jgi:uncharacterized delta-60 repeat protein
MRSISRFFLAFFVLALSSTPIWAIDYKLDQTFQPQFPSNSTIVYGVMVQPDGKIVAVGDFEQVNGLSAVFMVRLNPDGTTDPTFTSSVSPTGQTQSRVSSVQALPNGQMIITGSFKVGTQTTSYARLNADGSVDTTLPLNLISSSPFKIQPNGKYLICRPRTVGNDTYAVAHRMNPDGSVDPSFRITYATGTCSILDILPNGQILMATEPVGGSQPLKALQRLNSDGTLDPTFDPAIAMGTRVTRLKSLPDGKMLIMNAGNPSSQQDYVRRLNADGSLDVEIPDCKGGGFFIPLPDGNVMTNNCNQVGTPFTSDITRLLSNGKVDRSLDYIYFTHDFPGLKNDGDNFYVHGLFFSVDYIEQRKLARLIPKLDPPKAKYDFDGDGKSDVAVYRPSNGYWYLYQSTAGMSFVQWGLPGDIPAAMQFDADGKTDITIFRDGILHSNTSVNGYKFVYIGQTGDRPMTGNFSDQENDIGDFAVRGVENGQVRWLVKDGITRSYPGYSTQTSTVPGELATDKPVVGDFNADNRDDIGFFRDGYWYTRDYANWYSSPYLYQEFQWGMAGDIPVAEDYDGDRQTDYAVFRPSTGVWWVLLSSGGYWAVQFGMNGDIPVPADYDGDGKADIAVYRDGVWWQYLSATGTVAAPNWGVAGDVPIPAQMQ